MRLCRSSPENNSESLTAIMLNDVGIVLPFFVKDVPPTGLVQAHGFSLGKVKDNGSARLSLLPLHL